MQELVHIGSPSTGSPGACFIDQSSWIEGCGVRFQPVVDRLSGYPQEASNLSNGLALLQLQQGQGTTVHGSVVCMFQLLPQPETLFSVQHEFCHGSPPARGYHKRIDCQKTFADPLRLALSSRCIRSDFLLDKPPTYCLTVPATAKADEGIFLA